MSSAWTIDAIHTGLAHPEARQAFLRDINLTPVDELPAVVALWVRVVEEQAGERVRLEGLRDYLLEHGELPPSVEAGCVDITDDLLAVAGQRGAA